MDLVDDLVLGPFKDIAEKGKAAVENAGDAQPMLKLSQQLIRDGERALKKIEPLCKKHVEEYGSNFMDALKENDEIAQYRSDLNDLLWEFDDYIEVDDFDEEKFKELQAMSRKAAPRIYDIIMRMKLEPIPKEEREREREKERAQVQPLSPQSAPSRASVAEAVSPVEERYPPVVTMEQNVMAQLQSMMQEKSSLTEQSSTPPPQSPVSRKPSVPPVQEEEHFEPPRQPTINPWDLRMKPALDNTRIVTSREDFSVSRREAVIQGSPKDFISPVSLDNQRILGTRRLDQGVDRMVQDEQERRQRLPLPPDPGHPHNESPILGTILPAVPVAPKPRSAGYTHSLEHPIPEHSTVDMNSSNLATPFQERYSAPGSTSSNPSRQRSIDSFHSSILGTNSSSAGDNRVSMFSNQDNSNSSVSSPGTQSPLLTVSSQAPQIPPITPVSGPLEGQPIIMEEYEGLIPVDTEPAREPPRRKLPLKDTSITLSSSFYLQKGFCEGAKEVIRGDIGVKKVKKPSFSGSQLTAKCNHCFFELDWKEIELDINGSAEANFAIDNIGFRVRFLQKSHVATRRADEPFYACVFCIHEGKTPNESDATIFFSQKDLCDHLARHPRPLPRVPGVTVVESEKMPTEMKTNYDVHFRTSPVPSIVDEKLHEIMRLPTATAKETVKRIYGMKLLHDRTKAFEMAAGARIVGVEFPDKYNGEWCMGYHDGKYASFPFDVARLDAPPTQEIRMGGVSNVTATAKWKFAVKEKGKGDWLKFEKGEAITNISWVDKDHWCWAGTNAKGKWGIFPRSHIDEATLREFDDAERASIISGGTTKSKGMLSRFASRKLAKDEPPMPKTVY